MFLRFVPAQSGFGDVIEGLIQILVIVFFFGLPMLDGLRRKRQSEKAAPGRGASRPAPRGGGARSEAEKAGRDLWRELLEQATGEEASTAAPPRTESPSKPKPSPPPIPPKATPERAPTPRESAPASGWQSVPSAAPSEPPARRTRQRHRPVREDMPALGTKDAAARRQLAELRGLESALPPTPKEGELEARGTERGVSLEEGLERGASLESRLEAGLEPVRADLAELRGLDGITDGDLTRAEPAFGVSGLEAWRRAIVAAEVLGAPLALRGTPAPPGLER